MRLENGYWVEVIRCNGCNILYAVPRASFRLLAEVLPSQTKGTSSLVLLCDACNLLSAHSKPNHVQRTVEEEYLSQCVRAVKAFWLEVPCGTEHCATPVKALALTGEHMYPAAISSRIATWKTDGTVRCASGHAIQLPALKVEISPALFGSMD